LLLVSTALLTFALDDPAFNSTQSSVQIRLRMHQNQLVIYTPKSKKILGRGHNLLPRPFSW